MSFDVTIAKGTTSKIVEITMRDSSTGGGKTALAHGDVTASYVREGSTRTAITLAAGSAGDAYSSGKWCEVDSTNCKGIYQLHIPDAALATGVNAVTVRLQATGVIDKDIRISLLDVDLRNATTAGLTNLDAAISTRSTFDSASSTVTTDTASRTASQADISTLATSSALATVDTVVDSIKVVTDNLPDTGALTSLATAASIAVLNDLSAAQVNTEVDTALADYDAPTKAELDSGLAALATSAALATVDGVADSILVIANKLDSALELDGSDYRFTTNALEQGPSGTGGDATASNQSTIITHLSDIKGAGFASTDTLESIRDRGDAAWTTGGSGSGIYTLTVTVEDSSGDAVPNSRVNISGTTTTLVTDSNGQATFNVDADTYTLVTSPPSEYNTPDDVSVTVSTNTSQTITLTTASTSASAGWIG